MLSTARKSASLLPRSVANVGQMALERFYSFRIIYVAIFAFILLFVFTVKAGEGLLYSHFRSKVARAVEINDLDRPVSVQIQSKMNEERHDLYR